MSDEMIPKARLDAELAKHEATRAKLDAMSEKVSAMEAASGDLRKQLAAATRRADSAESGSVDVGPLKTRIKELEGQLEAANTGRAEDAAALKAGIQDVGLARFEHSRLGADAPPFTEWLESLRSDPSAAPATLRGFLPEPETEAAPVEPARPGGTAEKRGPVRTPQTGGDGSASLSGMAAKNQALKQIPHAMGSPEWREAARSILGTAE